MNKLLRYLGVRSAFFLLFAIFIARLRASDESMNLTIDGCYKNPNNIQSGDLRFTSFKDVLLLGSAATSPEFIAIKNIEADGAWEFLLFDTQSVKERYRISKQRNTITSTSSQISYSISRRVSAEGTNFSCFGIVKLTLKKSGDVQVNAEITTKNTTFLFWSETRRHILSFDLPRVSGLDGVSLNEISVVQDLPGGKGD